MRNKRTERTGFLTVCFLVACLGWTSLGLAGDVLRFGCVNNTSHPNIRAINEFFIDELAKLTNNKFDVQVFDNSQLGGERDMMEQLQAGMLQMCSLSPVLGAIEPAMNIFDLPFLFEDQQHLDEVLDGPIGKEILKDLPAKGLVCVAYFENGFRVTTNNVKPIKSLADLKGMKIRTPEAPVSVAIFNSLGANVTTISFSELYSALQQNVIDGQENAYNTIASSRYFEIQKYASETNHMLGVHAVVVNAKWWNGLDAGDREAVGKAISAASAYQRKIFREMTGASKQTCIDAGMEINTLDVAEFREAVKPVYTDFAVKYPQYSEVIAKIQGLRK